MPLHPATVHLPIGLLLGATGATLLQAVVENTVISNGVTVMLIGGLATGGLGATTGFFELWRLRERMSVAAETIIDRHLQLMTSALGIYGSALFLHWTERATAAILTSVAGAIVLLVGGHLGGKLVYEQRLGVVDGDSRPDPLQS